MHLKIQNWGNSLALRIPKAFVAEAHIHDGSVIDLTFRDGELLIVPVEKRIFRLSDLLKQIEESNLHSEIAIGEPVGAESW